CRWSRLRSGLLVLGDIVLIDCAGVRIRRSIYRRTRRKNSHLEPGPAASGGPLLPITLEGSDVPFQIAIGSSIASCKINRPTPTGLIVGWVVARAALRHCRRSV